MSILSGLVIVSVTRHVEFSRSKFIETLQLEVKNKDLFEIKFKTPLSEDLVKHLKKLK